MKKFIVLAVLEFLLLCSIVFSENDFLNDNIFIMFALICPILYLIFSIINLFKRESLFIAFLSFLNLLLIFVFLYAVMQYIPIFDTERVAFTFLALFYYRLGTQLIGTAVFAAAIVVYKMRFKKIF